MFFARWKRKIADSIILTTSDGRVVFYPLGAFKAYLVPKTAFEPLIIKSIAWFRASMWASFAVTTAIGVWLNINMDVLLLVGLLDYVHYYFRIRRITRKLVGLPVHLSMRAYASSQDPEMMWQRFFQSTFMAVLCGVVGFLGPPRALFWVGLVLLFSWTVMLAYLIYLHHRDNRATQDPSNRLTVTNPNP